MRCSIGFQALARDTNPRKSCGSRDKLPSAKRTSEYCMSAENADSSEYDWKKHYAVEKITRQ
jgi:hypothetical protein